MSKATEMFNTRVRLRIVDAHHHLWNLDGPISYPWLTDQVPHPLGDYSKIRKNFLPSDYRQVSNDYDVVASVHVEADADHARDEIRETEWLHQIHRDHGFPNAIVAHAWFDTPDAEDIIRKQSAYPLVRGIRSKPVTAATPNETVRGQPRSMQDDRWIRGLALLEKYDLSWDMRVPAWHLREAADVVRQFPSLRVVLNHTGCPWDYSDEGRAAWRRGMQALAACPNVTCKISGFYFPVGPWKAQSVRSIIQDAIAIFGVDRCMFASNFPVDCLNGTWNELFTIFKSAVEDRSREEQDALFLANALKVYRIVLSDGGDVALRM